MRKTPRQSDLAKSMSIDGLNSDDGLFARRVVAALDEARGPRPRLVDPGPLYLGLRAAGVLRFSGWYDGDAIEDALAAAFREAARTTRNKGVDAVELCQTHAYERVPEARISRRFSDIHRGIHGIEIGIGGRAVRFAPTTMIACNLSFEKAFERVLAELRLSADAFFRDGGEVWRFRACQFLISLKNGTEAIPLHRGARLVAQDAMTKRTLREMIDGLGAWLVGNLAPSGRMTYKYWPSRGEESPADNPIRQFMATICLGRLARYTASRAVMEAARRNLACNLERFFRRRESIGTIEHDGTAKLGAAALAALAIHELDARDTHGEAYRLLSDGVAALWQPDGAFRTFHHPSHRNDNQNFYPGEALLFWTTRLCTDRDEALLAKCRRSFAYYRDWHRAHRNPAFIPWHSQACARLFALTGERAFAAFVFEMNDWLLAMQQGAEVRYDDLRGRFYDPRHRAYGPPHASSTAVYLEGLAEALRLAVDLGEEDRARAYRRAIWRGLRNLRQLQFVDDADMFYISRRHRVRGGLRTEAYDNTIRVDNVQHALMALLNLMTLPAFAAELGAALARSA